MKKYNNSNAARVVRQNSEKVEQHLRQYRPTAGKIANLKPEILRIVPLGGQDGIGEKNMIVIEYEHDAIILDCGFDLGIDLPGINYAIPIVEYLEAIKHKIRAYVISHGHMDHIGALTHIVPRYPAPIYGSQFTIGMVETQFEKAQENGSLFQPQTETLDMDSHQRLHIGVFTIELVRVTHSIPESSAIIVDTPNGRLVNTGDFRLDPEPLDAKPSDIARLQQLGNEGVTLLMSESTNTTKLGRTPTEHSLQDSFYDLVSRSKGRLVVAIFSTNMNRIQMIINAAHEHGRKVALDGRSMMIVAELAIRLGKLRIPRDTLIPLADISTLPDNQILVVCTGGQGEPGAALSRMAMNEHRVVKLRPADTVVISSTPIPGNERSYARIGDLLSLIGVKQYRHPTHEIDGSGPLHVSGHASRDEHAEMLRLTKPTYLMPIYGGALNRQYHKEIALHEGMHDKNIIMANNGAVIEIGVDKIIRLVGNVTAGAQLIDQTGALVPEIVTRDRLQLKSTGFVIVVVTIDRRGRLVSSVDILTRGYIFIKDNPGVIESLRVGVSRTVNSRKEVTSKTAIELLRWAILAVVTDSLLATTNNLPVIIPVINVVGITKVQSRPAEDVR